MKKIFGVIVGVQCLYGMLNLSTSDLFAMESFQNRDELLSQKIASTDKLSDLLYLKAVAEKNEYSESLALVNDKLSHYSDVDELCKYISSYCDAPKNPTTLNRILYMQHSIEIVTAMSLLRTLLSSYHQSDQRKYSIAIRYYNIICRTVKTWN